MFFFYLHLKRQLTYIVYPYLTIFLLQCVQWVCVEQMKDREEENKKNEKKKVVFLLLCTHTLHVAQYIYTFILSFHGYIFSIYRLYLFFLFSFSCLHHYIITEHNNGVLLSIIFYFVRWFIRKSIYLSRSKRNNHIKTRLVNYFESNNKNK